MYLSINTDAFHEYFTVYGRPKKLNLYSIIKKVSHYSCVI